MTRKKTLTHAIVLFKRRSIAKHYLQGKSQPQISKLVNWTVKKVSEELQVLRAQWVQAAEIDFAEAQGAALNKIDDLEQEAVREYTKSKRPRKTIIKKRVPIGPPEELPAEITPKGKIIKPSAILELELSEQVDKIEEGTAAVKWHDQIMKCIDMRLKILGLYNQPLKTEGFDERRSVSVELAKETAEGKVRLFMSVFEQWERRIKNR